MGGLVSKGTSAFRGCGDKKENGRVILCSTGTKRVVYWVEAKGSKMFK